MPGIARKIVNSILVLIIITTFVILFYKGYSYYQTNMEERFFHPSHETLKPSGISGHGFGVVGTFLMVFGMFMYIVRKRMKALSRWGRLKHWLEVHIFLCTLGPLLILFHTSFKFGGIVAISFWSMVAVFLSGIIGRFIYIQIPRTIEGRELSLSEVRGLKTDFNTILRNNYHLNDETTQTIISTISTLKKSTNSIKNLLKKNNLSKSEVSNIVKLVKKDASLSRKIDRLQTMQKLFNYWHVAHMPFAIIMIVIMIIHVSVTIFFGYKWIF